MPKIIVFTEEQLAYITKRFEETQSVTRVSEETGFAFGTLKNLLCKLGYSTKSQNIPPEKEEPIKYDYIYTDLDIKEMAKKHGVKHDTIRQRAKKHGWTRLVWKRRYFREVWHRQMDEGEATTKMEAVSANFSRLHQGKGNPMYGKPAPQGAGNGWKGWYKGHYFRSLREAMFMVKCEQDGVTWTPGEKISIKYLAQGKDRTYRPDFIVGNAMIEIKPTRLQKTDAVKAKAAAGRAYCEAHGMEYRLIDIEIETAPLLLALDRGDIRFTRDYEERFRSYVTRCSEPS